MFILSNAGINSVATDVVFTVAMIVLTLAVLLVGVWLLVKFIGKDKNAAPKGEKVFTKVLTLLIFGGLAVRILLALLIKGHREDFDMISGAMDHIAKNGFSGYYHANGTQIYPLTLLIYALLGVFANAIGVTSSSYAMIIFVKLPLIAADIVSAIMIYKLARKYSNGYVASVISGMFLLMPVFMIPSSVWGSIYSLLTLGLILCMYFMATKNYLGLFASYTASLLVMKDALYLFPLFAVFIVYGFIKALRKVIKEHIPASAIFNDPDTCQVIRTPIYLVASFLVGYLLSLPTFISDYGASFFGWIYNFALRPLGTATSFGHNSLGIFNIFARNGDALGSTFPTVVFAVIFSVIILGIVLLIYLSKKNRANLVFLGSYIMLTLATYYVGFEELSLVPMLGLLLVAFILIKDKRILQIFGVLSIAVVINAVTVLVSAGYVNLASDYLFTSSFYSGTKLLDSGFGMAMSIVCSVLAVVSHLYSTLVLLDISMSGKRKLLPFEENANPIKSLALLIKP